MAGSLDGRSCRGFRGSRTPTFRTSGRGRGLSCGLQPVSWSVVERLPRLSRLVDSFVQSTAECGMCCPGSYHEEVWRDLIRSISSHRNVARRSCVIRRAPAEPNRPFLLQVVKMSCEGYEDRSDHIIVSLILCRCGNHPLDVLTVLTC